jgi:ABC-2 type transport system permease protein
MPIPFSTPQVIVAPMSELVDVRVFLPATVNLFALGLMVAGFTTMMSSWDRYRWRTIGIVVGIYVFQIIVKVVGLAADEVNWMLYLSAFTPYEPEAFVHIADATPEFAWSLAIYDAEGMWKTWGPMAHHLVMATVGIVSYLAAAAIFIRRDLPAPM